MTEAKRRGAPIGARIRQVCELLEKHGPINAKNLHAVDPQMSINDVTKYARRAVVHGFANIDRGTWPHSYSVKPDWRETVDFRGELRPRVERAPFVRVSSVWELGSPSKWASMVASVEAASV